MVIAMMLLGLGIGFVKGIFGKASSLPELIEIDVDNPPTAADPLKVTPGSLEIKSGDKKPVVVGIYNDQAVSKTFDIDISVCTGNLDPVVEALPGDIEAGDSRGFKVIVHAMNETATPATKVPPGEYICKLEGAADDASVTYESQFILTVSS